MSTKRKILLAILGSVATFVLLWFAIYGFVLYSFPVKGHPQGEVYAPKTVSPGGRWKVRFYYINPGAMASASYYARVTDLKGRKPRRDIPFGWGDQMQKETIGWKNANTIDVQGAEINVRTSTVKEVETISLNRRWKVQSYYYPMTDGRRSWDGRNVKYFYYMIVTDLRRKVAPRKIHIDQKKITRATVGWRSNNVINAYGDIIDLREPVN